MAAALLASVCLAVAAGTGCTPVMQTPGGALAVLVLDMKPCPRHSPAATGPCHGSVPVPGRYLTDINESVRQTCLLRACDSGEGCTLRSTPRRLVWGVFSLFGRSCCTFAFAVFTEMVAWNLSKKRKLSVIYLKV